MHSQPLSLPFFPSSSFFLSCEMRRFHWQPLESVKTNPFGLSIIVPKLTWGCACEDPTDVPLEQPFGSAFLHVPTPYPTSQIFWIVSFAGLMPSVLFWPLTSRKLDFKQENEHCPKSSFAIPPTFQPTDTSLLLPGAAGWDPGSLDPCCSFCSYFLPPPPLCDSICPSRFNIYLTWLLWDPCLGDEVGTPTIHGSAHLHSQTLSWHIRVGKNQEFY